MYSIYLEDVCLQYVQLIEYIAQRSFRLGRPNQTCDDPLVLVEYSFWHRNYDFGMFAVGGGIDWTVLWCHKAQLKSCLYWEKKKCFVSLKSCEVACIINKLAMEPLGRMSRSSCEALWEMARQARDKRITNIAPSQGYRKLRLCLERSLLWSMAERLIAATGRT